MHSLTWRQTYAGWVSTKLHEDTTKLQKYPHTGYSPQCGACTAGAYRARKRRGCEHIRRRCGV